MEITEISKISLEENEILIIRVPIEAISGGAASVFAKTLASIDPELSKRAIIVSNDYDFTKINKKEIYGHELYK